MLNIVTEIFSYAKLNKKTKQKKNVHKYTYIQKKYLLTQKFLLQNKIICNIPNVLQILPSFLHSTYQIYNS